MTSTEGVLLLNATFEPLHVLTWRRVVRLLSAGKVEVVEESDREIRSVSVVFRIPSVVRLLRYVQFRQTLPKLSRANVYARDDFTCAYCGVEHESRVLSLDHVVPKAQGGRTTWENLVTSCVPCNLKKANRTPAQARMRLRRQPTKPDRLNSFVLTFGRQVPPTWRNYVPSIR